MNAPDQARTVYGKYSLGSGAVLAQPDQIWDAIDAAEVIQSYVKSIRMDMAKAGIPLDALQDFRIMDVGTGRQAIAFEQLGAGSIRHYDQSPENVARMAGYIRDRGLARTLATERADLVSYPLPRDTFDLVYLNGVVHHFAHVARGLINCMGAVKPGGYLWLYFYRSGTFKMFAKALIRDLIRGRSSARDYFASGVLLFSDTVRPNFHVSNMMDDFFAPHLHLYTARAYLAFVERCGFEVVSSSRLDPLGRDVDHQFAHPAVVVTCRRTASVDLQQVDTEALAPERSVNQLDPALYTSSAALGSIAAYAALKDVIESIGVPDAVVMALALRLDAFFQSLDRTVPGEHHDRLRAVLDGATELLRKEYGRTA